MDFLAGCQALRQACGLSSSGPDSVVGQSGELKRFVDWYAQAWVEIQNSENDWFFMIKEASLSATGQRIDVPADLAEPIALTLEDGVKRPLTYLRQDQFKEAYRLTTFQTSQPTAWTVEGDEVVFNSIPDQSYSLTLEYKQTPQVLAANGDIPLLPTRFHHLIVYRAMIAYGMYETADEIVVRGKQQFDEMYAQLSASQTPTIEFAGPLA